MLEHEHASFRDLFADIPRKIVAIVTFLGILELVRSRRIKIMQSVHFSELRVYRGDRFDIPYDPIDLVGSDSPIEVLEKA